jgi:hypothetical protein
MRQGVASQSEVRPDDVMRVNARQCEAMQGETRRGQVR